MRIRAKLIMLYDIRKTKEDKTHDRFDRTKNIPENRAFRMFIYQFLNPESR